MMMYNGTNTGGKLSPMDPRYLQNVRNISAQQTTDTGTGTGSNSGWLDWLDSEVATNLLGLAGTAGSIYGALENADDTRDMGNQIQAYLDSVGANLNSGAQFQGYGVTSGTGKDAITSSFGPQPVLDANGNPVMDAEGNPVTQLGLNLGVGPDSTLMTAANSGMGSAGGLLTTAAGMRGGQSNVDYAANAATAMANSLADPSARQQEIYNQMMAVQNPELNRMQAEQQAAEYARGRGGIRGSQYGGTAEDAAMARARAQASNQAMLGAMDQTNTERQQFGNMAAQYAGAGNQAVNAYTGLGSMLGNLAGQQANIAGQQANLAYLPMQQQMALMQLGQQNADMAQTGQLTGLDYLAQLGLGGANANINAMHSANQLTGNLYNALLSNMGGVQGTDGSAGSGLLGAIGGGLGAFGDIFSGIFGKKDGSGNT